MLGTDSLAVRVIGLSSLWAIAALVVIAGLISTLYQRTASRGFEELLVAQLYNLVNSVSVGAEGELTGAPNLGDLRYSRPLSGWYWEVVPASPATQGRLASASLGAEEIPSPAASAVPFDLEYRRAYSAGGLAGERLRVIETEVSLESENHAARFRVMGNASLVSADVQQFNRTLALYLGAFGLGSILLNALAIRFGLRPLDRARRALSEVSAGKAERLQGSFPAEIRPLAIEMNGLIENNRRIIERARTQVGNLAHSLKTPIAVLLNEAHAIGGEKGQLLAEQCERMRVQVQHYLDRARMATQSEGTIFRTPVQPALERLVRVVGKLNPQLRLSLAPVAGTPVVFAGERQDFEEIVGNLLENAAKWTRSQVRVGVERLEGGRFATVVEDDGPGLGEAEIEEALKRGRRLDEATPGSGLGLAIVKDMVSEYRGSLALSRSELGGLRAVVVLPRTDGERLH